MKYFKLISITIAVALSAILVANYLDSYNFPPNRINSIQTMAKNSNGHVTALIVGDSVALTLGYDLALDEKPYDLTIIDKAQLGCGLAIGGEIQIENKVFPASGYCSSSAKVQWPQAYRNWISKYKPNLVVLLAGRWEDANRTYNGKWTNITQASFRNYVKNQLEDAVSIATSKGASLLLETEPCSFSGLQPNGKPWPEDSETRVNLYNSLLYQAAKLNPNRVYVQNLNGIVCQGSKFTMKLDGIVIRTPDGIHFNTQNPYQVGDILGSKLLGYWKYVGEIGVVRQHLLISNS
jgi:hypothetical protein